MFYTIYKTTNIINGKFYIGKHQTKDLNDGYMGSGKILQRAINKYGKENFVTEILHVCKSEKHMNTLEKILVVPDKEINYNLCDGGKGGFSYIRKNRLHFDLNGKLPKEQMFEARSKGGRTTIERYGSRWTENFVMSARTSFKGKQHTEESKKKIGLKNSKAQSGAKNSQHGTCWITNGHENKKIKKDIVNIPEGWYKGRIIIPL